MEENDERKIKGLQVGTSMLITLILFIDDVFLNGERTVREWNVFKYLVEAFCVPYSMEVIMENSKWINDNVEEDTLNIIKGMFPLSYSLPN